MFALLKAETLKNVETTEGVILGVAPSNCGPTESNHQNELCGAFDGVNTTLDFLAENMAEPKRNKSSSEPGSGDFNVFKSYEEAFDTFRNHPYKLERDKNLDSKLLSPDTSGNQITYGYTGDYIDMGRYMTGEPECFGSNVYGRLVKRVRIVYSISAAYYVNKATILRKSIGISQIIDWLESQGVRTEVIAVESSEVGHFEVTVKKFEDQFVYNDLLAVTHPEFLRRIFFRFAEYSPSWASGYGSSIDCNKLFRKITRDVTRSPFGYMNNEHTLYMTNEDINRGIEDVEENIQKYKKWLGENLPNPVETDEQIAYCL